MVHFWKIGSFLSFLAAAYYGFMNNMQMAIYMFVCGFYFDWRSEKEK